MTGHDIVRISVGLDGFCSVSCECGGLWRVSDVARGHEVAMNHHLRPNVSDPRHTVPGQPRDVPFDKVTRSEWVRAHMGSPPAPSPSAPVNGPTRRVAKVPSPTRRSESETRAGKAKERRNAHG